MPHDVLVPDATHVIALLGATTTIQFVIQPATLSVTVTVYVPDAKPVIVCVVPPLLHAYVKFPEPPFTVDVALPLSKPHEVSVPDATHVIALLGATVAVHTDVHPATASVTVTVYVPAAKLVIVCVFAPVLHAYVKLPEPP